MNDQIADVENYQSNGEELSFRTIVLEQYQRVLRLGSVEFHGGFWMEIVDKSGKEKLSYIPATHEAYSNAVNMLGASVHPYFDPIMTSAWNAAEAAISEHKRFYNARKVVGDESINNALMNEYGHARAGVQFRLFVALSDFLRRKGYLSDSDVVDE